MDKLNQLTNKLKSLQLTVLLAEDEVISQLLFKKLVDNIGCNTTIVEDGKQAITFLTNTKFDIIFLDLHMPFFSGYDVIEQIKKPTSINYNTPVILVSGTASEEEITTALANGFDKLLVKPYTPVQFYLTINTYCSSEFDIDIESTNSIDLTMIKGLYNNEQALIDSLLSIIKQELLKNLASMEEPGFFSSPLLIKNLIHKIRPSFNYLGLKEIAEQLLELEKKLEAGSPINNIKQVCENISFITKKTLQDLK